MPFQRIWIEEGCISCNLCEDLVAEVFEVPAGDTCRLRPDYLAQLARADLQAKTKEAVEACPVEVIKGA